MIDEKVGLDYETLSSTGFRLVKTFQGPENKSFTRHKKKRCRKSQ